MESEAGNADVVKPEELVVPMGEEQENKLRLLRVSTASAQSFWNSLGMITFAHARDIIVVVALEE